MKTKIALIQVPCQRCGKLVTTASRSIYGLDGLKAKWGVICQSCVTPEEQHEILLDQGQAISGLEV